MTYLNVADITQYKLLVQFPRFIWSKIVKNKREYNQTDSGTMASPFQIISEYCLKKRLEGSGYYYYSTR